MGPKLSHETKLNDLADQQIESSSDDKHKKGHRDIIKRKKIHFDNPNNPDSSKESEVLQIKQKHNKAYEDADLIENCILKNFFMSSLEKQARTEIIKEMTLAFVPKDTIIFEQGNYGNYFYILKEGEINLIIDNVITKKINKGESFGELALLHGAPRTGTCKANTNCYLWVMKRKNFKKIIDHINKINFEENKTFIQSIPVLSKADHNIHTTLCMSLIKEKYEKGTYIVKEGEVPTCISIIKEGEVNVMKKDKLIRVMKKGENFGERSVLVGTARTCDVIANSKVICYSIPVSVLQSLLGKNFQTFLYLGFIKNTFSNSMLFKRFNTYLIEKIFTLFEATNLEGGMIAFPKGYKKSSYIVVIIDGNLINATTGKIVAERGSILFEKELFINKDEVTDYDLVPSPDCLLIKANTDAVISKIGGSLIQVMDETDIFESLSKVSIFKNLPRKKMELISQKTRTNIYENEQKIIKEGEIGVTLYIVKSGKVDIFAKGKYIRTLGEKEYFGERALFYNEPRSATAVAKGTVELFQINQEDFMSVIESNMKKHLMNRLYLQDSSLGLDDLTFDSHLGAGNYGNVSLVVSKKNNFQYAIKGISRNQINHEQLHKNLELERKILLQIDHPFIVKLVKTLKDERFIYFLMEVVKGKELFDVIRDIGLLSKQQAQFYGGSMLLAMEYLHERKFIYRDIKPENIMVLYDTGYIKIIDFGTAKQIEDCTQTIIGTPHYMAPEVILGGGYSFIVDIWSIAVCLYEFLCGGVPFAENAEDPSKKIFYLINF
ncbi:MAG: cyclic nucleotide-binding serine/threonine-protein kinase [archaeon]|nr:cyclic nucleotide-binding serine/threonine-protein kinase [archaeon]